MHDVLVIGGGPAAMTAAVYLARHKLSFVMIAEQIGGQVAWSADVENYLGFHLLDGLELLKKFRAHLQDYASAFMLHEQDPVVRVEKVPAGFLATTHSGKSFEAKTLLVATGARHRTLQVPGEERLYGHGVTYCAACDAPLYRDKVVCVVGGGNSAMDAALFMEKYARRVVVVTANEDLKGDETMRAKIRASSKIRVLSRTKVLEILGERLVTGVECASLDDMAVRSVEMVDGVCIEIGLLPASQIIDFVAKDRKGQIIVDKFNATNVEGVWAAGDVTDSVQKQIAVAVGEGAKAALSIIHFFQTRT